YYQIIDLNGEMLILTLKLPITLTQHTFPTLQQISKQIPLTKSQPLSILLNKHYLQKYQHHNKLFNP
uniref:hypothetical protein n=1 Tax=Staphylococcus hominis TaxID=1290 RepID=UPI001C92F646